MNPSPASSECKLTPQNPWPGFASFTPENHQFFFGRDAEIAEIFRRVRRQRLTVLCGVSGLGKTSLLQAGLLPRLGGLPFHPVLIRLNHTQDAADLTEQVRVAINREIQKAMAAGVQIPRGPEPGEDLWAYLHDKSVHWLNQQGAVVFPVLIFDQFEEIFAQESSGQATDHRRTQFLDFLACLVENSVPEGFAATIKDDNEKAQRYDLRQENYRVVICLREDFLAYLESFKQQMPSVTENRMRLERMSEDQALQAVLGPGREILDEDIARRIVKRLVWRQGVDPVLLSLLCEQLNRLRIERNQPRITANLLEGERKDFIEGFYQESFKDIDPRVQAWVEDRLMTTSGRRVPAAFEDALRDGLPLADFEKLEHRRILHREKPGDVVLLELTHDLLCEPASRSRATRTQQRLAQENAARAAAAVKRENELRRQKRAWKIAFATLLFTCLLAVGAIILLYLYCYKWPCDRYYANYSKKFGVPCGVGLLNDDQVRHRPTSFKFTSQGKLGHVFSIQSIDGSGHLASRNGTSSYLPFEPPTPSVPMNNSPGAGTTNASGVAAKNSHGSAVTNSPDVMVKSQECQQYYLFDAQDRITCELDYDQNTNLLRKLVYPPDESEQTTKRRLFYMDASGLPISQKNSRASCVEIEYTKEGWERQFSYMDFSGHPEPGPEGQYSEQRQYDASGMISQIEYFDENGKSMPLEYGIAKYAYLRDQWGNIVRQSWLDADGSLVMNTNGFAIKIRKYDEWGIITNFTFCGKTGDLVLNSNGFAIEADKFDEHGNATELAYYGTNSEPVCFRGEQYFKETRLFDDHGYETNEAYFDAAGGRADGPSGFSIVAGTRDINGNLKEFEFYDTNNEPGVIQNTHIHKITSDYDSYGRTIRYSYFDIHGMPETSLGYCEETNRYDERGNLLEKAYLDASGDLTNTFDDYAKVCNKYDEQDHLVAATFFYHPPSSQGYAKQINRYDQHTNLIEQVYYDSAGQLTGNIQGYARETIDRNNRGDPIADRYYDSFARLVNTDHGYATLMTDYDERGNVTQQFCYDASGAPTNASSLENCARILKHYGDSNNLIDEHLFFEPATDNCVEQLKTFDSRSNVLSIVCLDSASNQINCRLGYAVQTNSYNEQGNLIETAYFDQNGQLSPSMYGYARLKKDYDSQGNVIRIATLDSAGNPANSTEGYVLETMTYDNHTNEWNTSGNQTGHAYFNSAGELTNGPEGFASDSKTYSSENRLVAEVDCYAPAASGCSRKITSYEDNGMFSSVSFFDAMERLVNGTDGYARMTNSYDKLGNLIEADFFDASGQLTNVGVAGYAKLVQTYNSKSDLIAANKYYMPPLDGYARTTTFYDTSRNPVKIAFFDAAGNPATSNDGYAVETNLFDTHSNLIEQAYCDASGRPVIASGCGCAIVTNSFDNDGNTNCHAFLDPSRRLVNSKYGYAMETFAYQNHKGIYSFQSTVADLADQAYFDAGGFSTNGPDGFARKANDFDAQGRLLQEYYAYSPGISGCVSEIKGYNTNSELIVDSFFGPDQHPVNGNDGYAVQTNMYDSHDNLVEQLYLDARGQPAGRMNGYRTVTHYDSDNNRIDESVFYAPAISKYAQKTTTYRRSYLISGESFFDTNGLLVNGTLGYAVLTNMYDSLGNLVEELYLDSRGRPASRPDGYRVISHYDTNNSITDASAYYAPATNGCFRKLTLYKDYLHTSSESYFDTNGLLINNNYGYAVQTNVYDSNTNCIKEYYLDASGNRTNGDKGYAALTRLFDAGQNPVKMSFYDLAGRPAKCIDGYSICTNRYDSEGTLAEQSYYDANGNLINTKQGYARKTTSSTDFLQYETDYFDANGRLVNNEKGYAREVYKNLGRYAMDKYFDAAGNPVSPPKQE